MFPKISKNTWRFTSVHTCIKDLPVYKEINKKYMYIEQVGFFNYYSSLFFSLRNQTKHLIKGITVYMCSRVLNYKPKELYF